MKTRLELAHDWAMKFGDSEYPNMMIEKAWDYADAMLAEDAKRNISEKPDSSEWQPDWSQAPDGCNWWAMDSDYMASWFLNEPYISVNEWNTRGMDVDFKSSPLFNYQGDWRDSLRKRPK